MDISDQMKRKPIECTKPIIRLVNKTEIHFVSTTRSISATGAVADPQLHAVQHLAHKFNTKACEFPEKSESLQPERAWCPGHDDIAGNETAYSLANEGTALGNHIMPQTEK